MRALILAFLAAAVFAQEPPFDLLIAGGRIVDGSGNAWYRADVGIRAGRIAAIGSLRGRPTKRTIDARNHVVAPGSG